MQTSLAFSGVVGAVRQGPAGGEWMKREHVPQEYPIGSPVQPVPNDAGRLFGNRIPLCRTPTIEASSTEVVGIVNVIGKRKAGAVSTAVAKISTEPNGINLYAAFGC